MQNLTAKVALVTGGARGLGEAICHILADAGITTIIADVRLELAEKVAQILRDSGKEAMAVALDVSSAAQVETVIEKIVNRYGRIDVLVNNAGIDLTVSIEEMPVQEWERILNVNLTGPFIMSKAVFTPMREQGDGFIINITSTAAKRAWANASAYHASKWGLLGFSHALHVEGRPHNIKVTAVVAGGMRTPFLTERFPELDLSTLQDPKNVAQTVLYLLMQPADTVIPEIMVLPMKESSWP
ncbi:SDR family oxidoreductase [Chroococcidiopsis thermalis]|uniref:Short-chain dehydrogenase/reductase SDR n=1 Tax=Chroococcidiopsis thermalis (strain PCC 7203) TaxID=251229 RepID=K9U0C6_CHRTP|nr:SDR family oxidoreductase [Chroococcidiopsis thermalis]AFY87694.1 short-chain dehydrogenase/reductase SDR [Chroococcidiopsis thermalis PCC 7203]